jgi:DNA-binding NtrC family response regulator
MSAVGFLMALAAGLRVEAHKLRHGLFTLIAAPPAALKTGVAEVAAEAPAPPVRAGKLLAHEQLAEHLADEQFGPAELADMLAVSEQTLYRRLGKWAGGFGTVATACPHRENYEMALTCRGLV